MSEFSHYSDDGSSKMVDITEKRVTERKARARGFIRMQQNTLELIGNRLIPKGNVFEVARIAGIMGAKNASGLIPMCHPLLLTFVDVQMTLDEKASGIIIESEVKLEGKTGVEMEALTAVSVAALAVYDMCKAVDKEIVISDIKLLKKSGGKSGLFIR